MPFLSPSVIGRIWLLSIPAIGSASVATLGCNDLAGIHQAKGDWDGQSGASTPSSAMSGASGDTSGATTGGQSGAAGASGEQGGTAAAAFTDAGTTSQPWAQWPMPNSPSSMAMPFQSYDAGGVKGVVIDDVTLLAWQSEVPPNTLTWFDSHSYCATLALAGGGWRLPSRIELISLLNPAQSLLMIDSAFSTPTTAPYWSGSLAADSTSAAWQVDFGFAAVAVLTSPLTTPGQVRCVR